MSLASVLPQVICLVILLLSFSLCSTEKNSQRHRRYALPLYYPRGGSFKIVFGFAMPIPLGLKQSMAWGWNLQFQYVAPQYTNNTSIYPPIVGRSREKRDNFVSDRSLAYSGIEAILNRNGLNGRACLLRSICENAMDSLNHEANGLYGHLLHIALTPDYGDGKTDPDLDPVYLEAKKAGEYGVNCGSLYPDCEDGNGLLDMISLLDE
ncbi:hypothetical protein Zmor_001466 [Zophobas morio]|uniref:Uncharacterized protein n=1 Tax=Zophobas morio TaxID=2755281 RepID=A0AA38MRX8_9CUCU|nr:hypothetical protein Zmor_001466 [Zophobas morio]